MYYQVVLQAQHQYPLCPPWRPVLSAKTFALAELEKATDKFSAKRILGEGEFGRAYCGDNQNGDREFIAEVEMLSRLHHHNLVKLIGICIEGWTRCLVYELVHNGSVESHLHFIFSLLPFILFCL